MASEPRASATHDIASATMKLLLVDDHPLFREGVALLLTRLDADLHVLEAATCEEGFRVCTAHADLDLILLDLYLGGESGMEGLAVFRKRVPQVPVVVMSSSEDEATVRQALDEGAMGFIPKSSSSQIMLNALRLVLSKGIYLPPLLAAHPPVAHRSPALPFRETARRGHDLSPSDLGLTPRQADVLYLVLQGKPVKLISRELGIGEGTVKGHVSAVLRALNVTTRTQAVVAAHRLGLRFARGEPARASGRSE
jgi:DNA-binding NarL/FixJ family response regulator